MHGHMNVKFSSLFDTEEISLFTHKN